MTDPQEHLDEIRLAITQLHLAAHIDADDARGTVATSLEKRFSGISERGELRDSARRSLLLYRGGMGSFQDVGSAVMFEAVERVHRALSRAARRWP
ncbi:hypothetical protein [Brachybacterium paraconglomeratum]|uniref:hypothetical protein n=1 Tax=Brachybacterium paraconglomeratum TaxID=173362 RepID=UPI0031E81EF0